MKSQSVTLHIDTSMVNEAVVEVRRDGTVIKKIAHKGSRAQAILPLIESALLEEHLSLSDLSHITAVTGPGSFTGLRVGLAVANMLGALLDIPVNGNKALVTPTYS